MSYEVTQKAVAELVEFIDQNKNKNGKVSAKDFDKWFTAKLNQVNTEDEKNVLKDTLGAVNFAKNNKKIGDWYKEKLPGEKITIDQSRVLISPEDLEKISNAKISNIKKYDAKLEKREVQMNNNLSNGDLQFHSDVMQFLDEQKKAIQSEKSSGMLFSFKKSTDDPRLKKIDELKGVMKEFAKDGDLNKVEDKFRPHLHTKMGEKLDKKLDKAMEQRVVDYAKSQNKPR